MTLRFRLRRYRTASGNCQARLRDRARTDGSTLLDSHREIGSIASTGFGLTGLCIAAERRWMPVPGVEGARTRDPALLRRSRLQHPRVVRYNDSS